MRGSIRKVLGLSLLGAMLAMPVVMAQGPMGGRKGGHKGGKAGGKGKAGKKAPTKGGKGGN